MNILRKFFRPVRVDEQGFAQRPNTWFHSIDLGGEITAGAGKFENLLATADIYFAPGIAGLSVLDVGAWDGFFSFEAERRGASRVLAVDKLAWGHGGWGTREAFRYARKRLGSKVEDKLLDLDETTRANVGGQFDIVLYNGIVYHDPNAYFHLREVSKIASQMITVETVVELMDVPRAAMVFYPAHKAEPNEPQNGCGPNALLMSAWLRSFGFEIVLAFDTPIGEGRRKIFMGFKPGRRFADFVAAHSDKVLD